MRATERKPAAALRSRSFRIDEKAHLMDILMIVILVAVAALLFDFTNGFHDTANAMATSIPTGGPSPAAAA